MAEQCEQLIERSERGRGFGYEQDFQRPVYPVHRVSLKKFLSVDQIARGNALMRGWVEVLARTGRCGSPSKM